MVPSLPTLRFILRLQRPPGAGVRACVLRNLWLVPPTSRVSLIFMVCGMSSLKFIVDVTSYCLQSCSWPWGFNDIIDWFKNIFRGKSSSKRSWEFLDAMWSSMEFLTGAQALWIAERLRWKLTSWAETIDLVSVIYYVGIGILTPLSFSALQRLILPQDIFKKILKSLNQAACLNWSHNKTGISRYQHAFTHQKSNEINFKRLNDLTFRAILHWLVHQKTIWRGRQILAAPELMLVAVRASRLWPQSEGVLKFLRMKNTLDLHLQRIQTCDVKTTGLSWHAFTHFIFISYSFDMCHLPKSCTMKAWTRSISRFDCSPCFSTPAAISWTTCRTCRVSKHSCPW